MIWSSIFIIADSDNGAGWFCFGIAAIVVIAGIIGAVIRQAKLDGMTPEDRQEFLLTEEFGSTNPALICPHCQTKGQVRTKQVVQKKGVSGAKATGAILTGGVSLLATGLSRKENNTQARCDACTSKWVF
jgi:hypothetical protein